MIYANNARNSNLDKFRSESLNDNEKEATKGGFLFKMIDDFRCNLERRFSFSIGGNGDGDW